jgi:integrase
VKSRKQSRRANGEGSIFWSDAKGRYVAMVVVGRASDGKLRRKNLYGKKGDRSSAARLGVKERMAKYVGRRGTRDGASQLKAFADQWIENAPIRTNTRTLYRWLSKTQFGALGARNLIDLEPLHIRQHIDGLEVGATAKRRFYSLLHRVLNEAVELDMISSNPASRVKAPHVAHREQRALTPPEVGYLLKAVTGDRLEALVILALTAAMGPAELFALRRRDVHLAEGYLMVTGDLVEAPGRKPTIEATKTAKRRRRIDLPPITNEALRRRLKLCLTEGSGELVFTSPEGAPIRNTNLRRRWWKPLLEKAAALAEKDARDAGDSLYHFPTDLRMYDMRHTANALMGYAGVALEVARERMGHSSIRLTADTYGHVYPSMQRDVAVRLETLFADIRRGVPESSEVALLHPLLHGNETKQDAEMKKAI